MQRENRVFANKTAYVCKFSNPISINAYITNIYRNTGQFSNLFLSKKQKENQEKPGRTIGAFSKYLRILGEVS